MELAEGRFPSPCGRGPTHSRIVRGVRERRENLKIRARFEISAALPHPAQEYLRRTSPQGGGMDRRQFQLPGRVKSNRSVVRVYVLPPMRPIVSNFAGSIWPSVPKILSAIFISRIRPITTFAPSGPVPIFKI